MMKILWLTIIFVHGMSFFNPNPSRQLFHKYNNMRVLLGRSASTLPSIAIVGRPNTGKTSIFNKLTDRHGDGGIVHDEPGVTRDRSYRAMDWNEFKFQIVDTGGIIFDEQEDDIFAKQILEQAVIAINEATIVFFVVDGIVGLTHMDTEIASYLRRHCKIPIYVLVNKCESVTAGITQTTNFYALGLGSPYPVSGIHGRGLSDILDEVTTKYFSKDIVLTPENSTNVAIIGRPNAGKSSLFNSFCGFQRVIVSSISGTTRDSIDQLINRQKNQNETLQYRIVDTAGIRKESKVAATGTENLTVKR